MDFRLEITLGIWIFEWLLLVVVWMLRKVNVWILTLRIESALGKVLRNSTLILSSENLAS